MTMTTTPYILVIEDDMIMREALTDWLQAAGYGVRAEADGTAGLAAVKFGVPAAGGTGNHLPGTNPGVRAEADGTAALAAVKFAVPAAVVTDIHMPGTNGAAIISELKQYSPQVVVIAISGLFNSGHGLDAEAALALGAARVLAKPFKRAELLRAMAELLGSSDP